MNITVMRSVFKYLHHEAGIGPLGHDGRPSGRVAGFCAHPGGGASSRPDAGHALLVEVPGASLLL